MKQLKVHELRKVTGGLANLWSWTDHNPIYDPLANAMRNRPTYSLK